MMKEYFIAMIIVVSCSFALLVLCYLADKNYDIMFIELMLIYLVINKLSEAIRNDKKEE
jgi:hypothetical protein